ncbi:MAG: hypothetical protein IPL54_03185 [Chitinophagaceae bacterium]|nr:hypothetical protein [Chitinophagaceae bacterium]
MFPEFLIERIINLFKKTDNKYISGEATALIINDIPRFVDSGSYASLFGDQWKEYKKHSWIHTPVRQLRKAV